MVNGVPAGAASVPGMTVTVMTVTVMTVTVMVPAGRACQTASVAPSVSLATVRAGSPSSDARMMPPRQSPATVRLAAISTAKPFADADQGLRERDVHHPGGSAPSSTTTTNSLP